MRQVVLDTETTGLEPEEGHRILELGGVEILDRRVTGRHFHHYVNPQRDIDEGALEVHGISREFLEDKPLFADVWPDLLEFVRGAEVIIHNAAFDVSFINHELELMREAAGIAYEPFTACCTVVDSLLLARQKHPGQKNSLDALCRRYEIDNSKREYHGALLDAQLLAEVYLALTGGQVDLGLEAPPTRRSHRRQAAPARSAEGRPRLVPRASPEELERHRSKLAEIDKRSVAGVLWHRLDERD